VAKLNASRDQPRACTRATLAENDERIKIESEKPHRFTGRALSGSLSVPRRMAKPLSNPPDFQKDATAAEFEMPPFRCRKGLTAKTNDFCLKYQVVFAKFEL
jgi:hypothetical protein